MRALFEIQRPGGECLRLTVQRYRGAPRIDLRLWYVDDAGKLCPGKKGMTLPAEAVAALVDALGAATRLTVADLPPAAND